jgi:hypothetical protein
MNDFANRRLLSESDVDRLAGVLANLLEEVVALSERVAKLEGAADADEMQDRINRLVDRVMAPLG